jgi:hypothetical protein
MNGLGGATRKSPLVLIKLIDALPGGQGDTVIHAGIGRQDDAFIVRLYNIHQPVHQFRTAVRTVILDHDPAILQVVDLELVRHRIAVHAPLRQGTEMRA